MAVIILALLSSPSRRAPLKVVREMLVEKGGPSAARAVYACVAKRLIQIERGGGEQIIVFDLGSS